MLWKESGKEGDRDRERGREVEREKDEKKTEWRVKEACTRKGGIHLQSIWKVVEDTYDTIN